MVMVLCKECITLLPDTEKTHILQNTTQIHCIGNDVEEPKKYLSTNQQKTKIAIEEKFTKNVPQWKSFDKF